MKMLLWTRLGLQVREMTSASRQAGTRGRSATLWCAAEQTLQPLLLEPL